MGKSKLFLVALLAIGGAVFIFLAQDSWQTKKGQVEKKENVSVSDKDSLDALVEKARFILNNYEKEGIPPMQGVSILTGIIQEHPDHIPTLEALGEFSVMSGQLKKAQDRYKKLLSLQPENEGYRKILEEICIQLGENC
jgi:hypothetical protein